MELLKSSFRNTISTNNLEKIIFAYELLSQPDENLLTRIPHITHRNQTAITFAKEDDIVLLNQPIDQQYLRWLRNLGLGTDKIYEFEGNGKTTLPELIKNEEKEFLDEIIGRDERIYVPRISTTFEEEAAKHIGATLFGSPEELVFKYYNKGKFKSECEAIDVPVVPYIFLENTLKIQPEEIIKAAKKLLHTNDSILFKETTSSSGVGMINITQHNLEDVAYKLGLDNKKEILLEEKIDIFKEYSSQWSIGLDKKIHLIGICELHTNSKGSFTGTSYPPSDKKIDEIINYSLKIVEKMCNEGYIGNTQLDFLETREGEILCGENNTRLTGSSCSWEIYNTLYERDQNSSNFISTKFFVPKPTSFNILKEISNKFIYDGQKENYFFPYDIGALPITGEFMGLVATPEIEHTKKILKILEEQNIKPKMDYELI